MGLLVSFTATAGTESAIGSSIMPERDARIVPALPPGTALIGSTGLHDGAATLLAIGRADGPVAATRIGEEPLRAELKPQARVFPVVQRAGKGGAALSPGPSFARSAGTLRESGTALVFANLTNSVSGVLTPGAATWNPELEPDLGFVPVPDLGLTTGPGSAPSTGEAVADRTPEERHDGSTPAIPRAVALSSTTPAPADAIPIEVAAASLALPGFSLRGDRAEPAAPETAPETTVESARHRYADLIEPDAMDREQRCLAEAVYFEARSEPEDGQAAVAQVVLNRVKSGLYPANVCGVVYQNRHRYMGCQFSFACEGKSLRITDAGSWQTATRIASSVIEGRTYLSEVGNATHYHADYVRPTWSRRLKKMDVIGRHIFYQLKRGQT
ncbi:cell wall hydrolase [Methylobacterium planeticum]|uniref:Cell wall hydrolase n=2 Tax=Methylobacterium planeticum TaxID=2615211 RepID=A0A6N6MSZ2_9HYPH|nr:cell wall hydrolase [Methylobacterium planeticum]